MYECCFIPFEEIHIIQKEPDTPIRIKEDKNKRKRPVVIQPANISAFNTLIVLNEKAAGEEVTVVETTGGSRYIVRMPLNDFMKKLVDTINKYNADLAKRMGNLMNPTIISPGNLQ